MQFSQVSPFLPSSCPDSLLSTPFANAFHRRTAFNMPDHVERQGMQKLIKLMAFQFKKKNIFCNYKMDVFVSKYFNGQNLARSIFVNVFWMDQQAKVSRDVR